MLIDLVDTLRCVADHEETWLVATVDELRGRHLVRGTLGCHVCGAQYGVADGTLRLATPESEGASTFHDPRLDAHVRVCALLDLAVPGGIVLLGGAAGLWSGDVERHAECHVVQINPTASVQVGPGVSTVVCGEQSPFAQGSLRGVYWAGEVPPPRLVASLITSLRPGGRFVAPVGTTMPVGLREMARDESEWVAVREGAVSSPIPLRRAGQSSPAVG